MVFPRRKVIKTGRTDLTTIWNWPPRRWSRTPANLRQIPVNGNRGSTSTNPLGIAPTNHRTSPIEGLHGTTQSLHPDRKGRVREMMETRDASLWDPPYVWRPGGRTRKRGRKCGYIKMKMYQGVERYNCSYYYQKKGYMQFGRRPCSRTNYSSDSQWAITSVSEYSQGDGSTTTTA
jgi:hypothetical protein